jgi:hypothetical protein
MEKQKTQISWHNIEGEQSWRTDTTWLQDSLLSYSNQDCVIEAGFSDTCLQSQLPKGMTGKIPWAQEFKTSLGNTMRSHLK